VDLLVDGWLVIECDSREFHSSWEQQLADRTRDLALAARGYSCLRLTAAQVMYRPEEVLAPLRGLVEARRRVTG
jgi:very-short-patch-repair endonuclease